MTSHTFIYCSWQSHTAGMECSKCYVLISQACKSAAWLWLCCCTPAFDTALEENKSYAAHICHLNKMILKWSKVYLRVNLRVNICWTLIYFENQLHLFCILYIYIYIYIYKMKINSFYWLILLCNKFMIWFGNVKLHYTKHALYSVLKLKI